MIKSYFESRRPTQENCIRYLEVNGGKIIKTTNSIYLVDNYVYNEDKTKHEQVKAEGEAVCITELCVVDDLSLNPEYITAIEVYKSTVKGKSIIAPGRGN